jgi:NADPH-dependent 2,4-dienoyl-CoA reductase/sulfur reductase-like enzyme/nitrite reductase/ring-hydroxylating ferredoxin subunit
MAQEQAPPSGPDLIQGVALTDLVDGKLLGHVGADQVLLVQTATAIFAVDALCSHYHAPLADGVVVGNTIRCPWHHACFDLQTGEAIRPPAWNPLACWNVEQLGGRIVVREKRAQSRPEAEIETSEPKKIVIVGGGAAGFAAAERLRRKGYRGSLVMLSQEAARPVDRPNLSKDNLAGTAPEEWAYLEPSAFYAGKSIDLRLDTEVLHVDPAAREITVTGGERLAYDRLLLATGAEPVRLAIPGADQPHVHSLRSLTDCRAIVEGANGARRVLVIGTSFIGMEAAASLRVRGLEVHVVSPDERPMQRALGPEIGDFVRALHEEHGVFFHLRDTVTAIDGRQVTLKSGGTIEVDLIVVGVGVRPRLALAEQAGLRIDRGVVVDRYLETSVRGVFAAGDIARWPDPHSGENIRVEHWLVAQRQGQTAACNMLGLDQPFDAVPFFWSQHYDVPINYVGHAEQWDEIVIDGDIKTRNCLLRYKKDGRVIAVASIFRDADNLRAELAIERDVAP